MASEKHTSDIGLGIGSMLNTFNDDIGTTDDWIKAYDRFCKKTVNVHGKPTNRKHLLKHSFKNDSWFKNSDNKK
tara:strand:- start:866 stop:1087 length:222 start_codon:yes stop_codon:yes gene_type:complete